jgi:AcrR family transcriptional regulator
MSKAPRKSSSRSVPGNRRVVSRAARASDPKVVSADLPLIKISRAERAAERRQAIIDAAMEEFISRGFAATRLDDIAKRAGVAKGTIYLHFKDKESMFEELIRTAIVPLVGRMQGPPPAGASVRDLIEAFALNFIHEIVNSRRGDIVRLIVAEGPRFPDIADFYYREVVSKGLAGMRMMIELGIARGEIKNANLAKFPQIMVAPAMIAVIWQSLFAKHAPLDAVEMFRTHLDLIFGERRTI